jgi:2-hydroxy-3-oxopropionate reductase
MASSLIGFVGIGRMGSPMAKRLIEAGHSLIVTDPNSAAVQELVSLGARAAKNPAEIAAEADVALLSLPTPDVVRTVAFGPDCLANGGKLRVVIDLSTTGPRVAAELAEGLAAKNIATIDCPVSGGVAGAVKGSLALMTACPRPLFDEFLPILQRLGKPVHVGEKPGMAQMMKVLNNLMSVTALAITSEALVLGTKAGLDPDVMIEVFNMGSGRNSATMDKIPNFVLPRTFDFGFALSLSTKDAKLCLDESEALGVPMIVGSAVRQLLTLAKAKYGPDADLTTLIKPIEEWAGVEVVGAKARR